MNVPRRLASSLCSSWLFGSQKSCLSSPERATHIKRSSIACEPASSTLIQTAFDRSPWIPLRHGFLKLSALIGGHTIEDAPKVWAAGAEPMVQRRPEDEHDQQLDQNEFESVEHIQKWEAEGERRPQDERHLFHPADLSRLVPEQLGASPISDTVEPLLIAMLLAGVLVDRAMATENIPLHPDKERH